VGGRRGRPAARAGLIALAAGIVVALTVLGPEPGVTSAAPGTQETGAQEPGASWPVQHVVVIYQENHSFDNVLGVLCRKTNRCDGATFGKLPDGTLIQLSRAADLVPDVGHSTIDQSIAMDGGLMDGFANISGCTQADGYACYSQFGTKQIPNLAALARRFAISDRTFELEAISSWGAHLELVTTTLDGFAGNNPKPSQYTSERGPGWGCDSLFDANWKDPDTGQTIQVPSCVPDQAGFGPYRPSPVQYVPTLMDTMDAAGVSWKLYASGATAPRISYGWSICPTFAECLYSSQASNVVAPDQILADAAAGSLPNFSVLLPDGPTSRTSQHNDTSMAEGDNWIGQVVQAIEDGPDWPSTAVFITYDDCGCFYDHVPPAAGMGIRVPMVIVSPFARRGFTDSTTASFASLLAFTEHAFGLEPLSSVDAGAYDYSDSFNFGQSPVAPVRMVHTKVPLWERRWVAAHPDDEDGT
jgi:phospholipase C